MVILTCGWCCRIVNCVTAVWPARWIPWPDDEDAWAVQPQPHPLALCGILALSGVGGYDGWLFGDAVGGRDLVMDVALWKVCWLCWQHENGLCCCQFGWCHPSQQVFAVFSLRSLEELRMFTAQFSLFAWLLHVPPSLSILFYKTHCLVGAMPPMNGIIVAGIVIVTRIIFLTKTSVELTSGQSISRRCAAFVAHNAWVTADAIQESCNARFIF